MRLTEEQYEFICGLADDFGYLEPEEYKRSVVYHIYSSDLFKGICPDDAFAEWNKVHKERSASQAMSPSQTLDYYARHI